jgi:hypothetical protein
MTLDLCCAPGINQFFPIYRRRFARQVDYWTLLFIPGVRAELDIRSHQLGSFFYAPHLIDTTAFRARHTPDNGASVPNRGQACGAAAAAL